VQSSFKELCQQHLRTLPLLNIGIHCGIQLSKVEVIDHQFVGSCGGLCLFARDCIDDVGCNSRSHYFTSGEVLAFGVFMLEGHDGVVWKDHVRNCVPSLAVIRADLRCMLCGSRGGATHMLVCDKCFRGWHMACMTPPMDVPIGRWVCLRCTLEG
jgi:hypothetical protein